MTQHNIGERILLALRRLAGLALMLVGAVGMLISALYSVALVPATILMFGFSLEMTYPPDTPSEILFGRNSGLWTLLAFGASWLVVRLGVYLVD